MAAKFDFGAFYLLGEGFIRGALRLRVRDELPYPWEDLANGRAVPTEAVAFSWDEGGEPRDLVGSSNMLDLISHVMR